MRAQAGRGESEAERDKEAGVEAHAAVKPEPAVRCKDAAPAGPAARQARAISAASERPVLRGAGGGIVWMPVT